MLNGLYSSATALDALAKQQEATASNLAHLNTPGHRRMVFSFEERLKLDDPNDPRPGTKIQSQSADFSPGRQQQTGRPLDLALSGDAFFVYRGSAGEMYSRSGVVFRNPDTNELVNSDGFPMLDESRQPLNYDGPISELAIGSDGTLSSAGQTLGKVAVVKFSDNRLLESENQTYFRAGNAEATPAEDYTVQQGSRELSNASAVTEMISLMVGSRHFEASQRAIRMISDAIQENTRS